EGLVVESPCLWTRSRSRWLLRRTRDLDLAPRPNQRCERDLSRGIRWPVGRPVGGTDSHPQSPLAVRGEGQTGADILSGEIGKVGENLVSRHAAREVFEHVSDRYAQTADAGLPAALARLDCNEARVVHIRSLPANPMKVNVEVGMKAKEMARVAG